MQHARAKAAVSAVMIGIASTLVAPLAFADPPVADSQILTGTSAAGFFGFSVSTSGDVNGDGFSDLLVGSPNYSDSVAKGGRVQLFLGTPLGVATTPVWTVEGSRAQGKLGFSVCAAGDVNGDGFDDVVVGAPGWLRVGSDDGIAFVYYGSPSGPSITADRTLSSVWEGARFGESVSTAGDINGDGYCDIVIGAPKVGGGFFLDEQGSIYVYHGSASGIADDFSTSVLGPFQAFNGFGSAVAGAGDLNGDGFDDIVVGAPSYDANALFPDHGRVQVYYGSPSGIALSADWSLDGPYFNSNFGKSVATAGDVNGDGYADLLVGAPNWFNGTTEVGLVSLYLGSSVDPISPPVWTAEGSVDENLGFTVATAGDVDGDGYADIIMGSPFYAGAGWGRGRVELYRGSSGGPSLLFDWGFNFATDNSVYAWAVASAGDLNGDGHGDIVIGIPQYDAGVGQDNAGRVEVLYGQFRTGATSSAWTGQGDEVEAYFGAPMRPAGDLNGDGYDDLIVGVSGADVGQTDNGRIDIFHGSPDGPSPYTAADATVAGTVGGDGFGSDVARAGDVDGDGYDDVLVGIPYHNGGQNNEGKVVLFRGSATGLITTPAWERELDQADGFLFRVAGAGDVNGDGFADILVAATGWDGDFSDQGKVWLHLGSETGPEDIPTWSFEGTDLVAFLGSLATAGDVNGDGYDDVLVGVGNYTDSFLGEGIVRCFYGSANGLSVTPDWEVVGAEVGAHLKAVASAGDVNGDGYADVIVGAMHGSAPQGGSGWARIYHGSASGLSLLPAVTLGQVVANSRFGATVTGAGDVNGDGFSDVMVGAPDFGGVVPDGGAAYLYLGSAVGIDPNSPWSVFNFQTGSNFGRYVAGLGDVDGDGYADVGVAATLLDNLETDEGMAYVYRGGGDQFASNPSGPLPRQLRNDGSPLTRGGRSDDMTSMKLEALARSAAGRTSVRLEWMVETLGAGPLPTVGTLGSWTDTGAVVPGEASGVTIQETATGLVIDTEYRWRLRVRSRSPFFPWSRWMGAAGLVPTLASFRTDVDPVTAVPQDRLPTVRKVVIESVHPNPFNPRTSIVFSLARASTVELRVYDLRGRFVRRLLHKSLAGGQHTVTWDGLDDSGHTVASGVYIARIRADGSVANARMVLAK